MRRTATYVEADVGMADDHTTAAWVFDVDLWGRCGQGPTETAALSAVAAEIGDDVELVVEERIIGDEQAFARDHRPATREERAATLAILDAARRETLALISACPTEVLDFDDPERTLPTWARWRTLRQMAWHLVDCESRYYLPMLGLPGREAEVELTSEPRASARHVRDSVETIPSDLVDRSDGQVWTTVKLLRRLAWHERSELVVMKRLAARARMPGGFEGDRP